MARSREQCSASPPRNSAHPWDALPAPRAASSQIHPRAGLSEDAEAGLGLCWGFSRVNECVPASPGQDLELQALMSSLQPPQFLQAVISSSCKCHNNISKIKKKKVWESQVIQEAPTHPFHTDGELHQAGLKAAERNLVDLFESLPSSFEFFSSSCRSFVGEPNVIRFGSLGGIRMTAKYARFQNNF